MAFLAGGDGGRKIDVWMTSEESVFFPLMRTLGPHSLYLFFSCFVFVSFFLSMHRIFCAFLSFFFSFLSFLFFFRCFFLFFSLTYSFFTLSVFFCFVFFFPSLFPCTVFFAFFIFSFFPFFSVCLYLFLRNVFFLPSFLFFCLLTVFFPLSYFSRFCLRQIIFSLSLFLPFIKLFHFLSFFSPRFLFSIFVAAFFTTLGLHSLDVFSFLSFLLFFSLSKIFVFIFLSVWRFFSYSCVCRSSNSSISFSLQPIFTLDPNSFYNVSFLSFSLFSVFFVCFSSAGQFYLLSFRSLINLLHFFSTPFFHFCHSLFLTLGPRSLCVFFFTSSYFLSIYRIFAVFILVGAGLFLRFLPPTVWNLLHFFLSLFLLRSFSLALYTVSFLYFLTFSLPYF